MCSKETICNRFPRIGGGGVKYEIEFGQHWLHVNLGLVSLVAVVVMALVVSK